MILAFVSIFTVSCTGDDVDNRPVVDKVTAPTMVVAESNTQFELLLENANEDAGTFVWTPAVYSSNVVIDYTVLMDVAGGDFSEPQTLGSVSNATELTMKVKTLNQAAIALGAPTEVATNFDIKVVAKLSGALAMESEVPLTISVTAYPGLLKYEFTDWYLVGDATASGWNNNGGNQPLFRTGADPKVYKFTGFFKKGAFKLVSNLGSWAPAMGKADGTTLSVRNADADPEVANFDIATDGFYTFTMNVETLKYTLVAFDATAAKTFTTVGIIGDSTPGSWDSSTPLVQSTFDSHIWTLGVTELNDGGAKFRADNAWDVSWGGNTAFSGGGSGDNIPVEKSKYLIYFNDLDGSYLLIPNQ